MHRAFHSYGDYRGSMDRVRKGAIISTATGVTTTYALGMLEARGTLFVGSKVDVYEGMIIGENSREETMEVNPTKEKKLTNMRGGVIWLSTCHARVRSRLKKRQAAAQPRYISVHVAVYTFSYWSSCEMIERRVKAVWRINRGWNRGDE